MIEDKNLINRTYVLYFCNKLNLLLVYKKDFFNEEDFKAKLKEVAYTKIKLVDNELTLAYHSSNSVVSHNIEEKGFEFYDIEEYISKPFNVFQSLKNLEFGKNGITGCSEFCIINIIEKSDTINLIDLLDSLKPISYEEIKRVYFSKNNIYGFEPIILFSIDTIIHPAKSSEDCLLKESMPMDNFKYA